MISDETKKSMIARLNQLMKSGASEEIQNSLNTMNEDVLVRLAQVLERPDLNVKYYPRLNEVSVYTSYGNIRLNASKLDEIQEVHIAQTQFAFEGNGIDTIEKLTGSYEEIKDTITHQISRPYKGRRWQGRRRNKPEEIDVRSIQEQTFGDLSRAGLTYENLKQELCTVLNTPSLNVNDLMDDLQANEIDEEQIPYYLVYESPFKGELLSALFKIKAIEEFEPKYEYTKVQADDTTFIGRLIKTLGEEEGNYDAKLGVLMFEKEDKNGNTFERKIKNIPHVDEKGVFGTKKIKYIPHKIGYFTEGMGSRMDRLRVIDPVENAILSVRLQYELHKKGNIRFPALLDVTRNLIDFDNHPYGEEILETLKNKVKLAPRYENTNSYLAEFSEKADELGAVDLTMLDDDARGIIDPLGTSNGKNLGKIFYLCDGVTINTDGSLNKGTSRFSKVGEIIAAHHADKDNFNRHQMSFNAFLTSLDVCTGERKKNVFMAEFGMWNAEDAIVLTHDFDGKYHVGDKFEDLHGNKSVVSVILNNLTEEQIEDKKLEQAVAFAKANPDVDMIVSPISLASRMNMGIVHEALEGEKKDVVLPNGQVVKDGCIQLTYMQLPQTAEHKSKDYELDSGKRKYSTLLRYALTSKVKELYKEGLLSKQSHDNNVNNAVSIFYRLGVSFKEKDNLIQEGNVMEYVDSDVTVPMDKYFQVAAMAIRLSLMNQLGEDRTINIDLGDIEVISPLTGKPVLDSQGRNVLPIRLNECEVIPYRYMDLLTEISRQNKEGIQRAYYKVVQADYSKLTVKNNILKNIDTMEFDEGARTTVIVPDPSVPLGSVRSNVWDNRLIIHRDPAIQSGNACSVNNVYGAEPNVLHINPCIANQFDADFDGDTMGENAFDNLNLSEEKKDEFFKRSCVEEQANYYGNVFLNVHASHFKALATANGMDLSDISFADGKSNEDVVRLVEEKQDQILRSASSYGAYAISFENEKTAIDCLGKLADDGIKGKRRDMEQRFYRGYTREENRDVARALRAKSEWTGIAGSITNDVISNVPDDNYDLLRYALDVTHGMTQSVLQMKHNPKKLPDIDQKIKQTRKVMEGEFTARESRDILKITTEGLKPTSLIDKFCDEVDKQCQTTSEFGYGVVNNTGMSTMRASYSGSHNLSEIIEKASTSESVDLHMRHHMTQMLKEGLEDLENGTEDKKEEYLCI